MFEINEFKQKIKKISWEQLHERKKFFSEYIVQHNKCEIDDLIDANWNAT